MKLDVCLRLVCQGLHNEAGTQPKANSPPATLSQRIILLLHLVPGCLHTHLLFIARPVSQWTQMLLGEGRQCSSLASGLCTFGGLHHVNSWNAAYISHQLIWSHENSFQWFTRTPLTNSLVCDGIVWRVLMKFGTVWMCKNIDKGKNSKFLLIKAHFEGQSPTMFVNKKGNAKWKGQF